MAESLCKIVNLIILRRVIRCTKKLFLEQASKIITIGKLHFLTGGGTIEYVLETPKLAILLFITITIIVKVKNESESDMKCS